jgi:hypothetical protein
MAYRTFVDDIGSHWQVWDVRPERVERRSIERRKTLPVEWTGEERRLGHRRKLERRRVMLDEGLSKGWLLFESLREKRRLAPIPSGWEKFTQSQLRMLCEKARIVKTRNNENWSIA